MSYTSQQFSTTPLTQESGDLQNILRILVVTDNHVGYKEHDIIRGDDSFIALEEILMIAKQLRVDCICHSGDLFDLHKPSRLSEYKVIDLLRKYCLGDDPVRFEVLNPNDPVAFPLGSPNFLNPDINISIPIFIIHGNHDDPGDDSRLSAIDILSISYLVNYFGKVSDLDDVKVSPILLRKGTTKLALYGLGNIRDERLYRSFKQNKVKFLLTETGADEYFNLFMIHQNRYKGNPCGVPNQNCIPEQLLPDFLDLIIWGHEHDCQIDPIESLQGAFHIIQPGSSCITSLSMGEALPKHICLLEICGDGFRSTPIPLRTTRPYEYAEVCLAELGLPNMTADEIWDALAQEVETMIKNAIGSITRREDCYKESVAYQHLGPNFDPLLLCRCNDTTTRVQKSESTDMLIDNFMLPIIRLRVEHTGYSTISMVRFAAQFIGKVANPDDLLSFYKKRKFNNNSDRLRRPELEIEDFEDSKGINIQDLICNYLSEDKSMEVLPEKNFSGAVKDYVHKMNHGSIDRFVKSYSAGAIDFIQMKIKEINNRTTGNEYDVDRPNVITPQFIKQILREHMFAISSIDATGNGGDAEGTTELVDEKNKLDAGLLEASRSQITCPLNELTVKLEDNDTEGRLSDTYRQSNTVPMQPFLTTDGVPPRTKAKTSPSSIKENVRVCNSGIAGHDELDDEFENYIDKENQPNTNLTTGINTTGINGQRRKFSTAVNSSKSKDAKSTCDDAITRKRRNIPRKNIARNAASPVKTKTRAKTLAKESLECRSSTKSSTRPADYLSNDLFDESYGSGIDTSTSYGSGIDTSTSNLGRDFVMDDVLLGTLSQPQEALLKSSTFQIRRGWSRK